ncbi:hypothetical protein [Planotetraspora sp. GP83]|uniref:hypothetical protein n=1 Tax=Planotetraspora sp. GP83 TaxID=3156264 RepID=UPI00351853A1
MTDLARFARPDAQASPLHEAEWFRAWVAGLRRDGGFTRLRDAAEELRPRSLP